MLTMDEYTVIDRIYPNYLELGDLIRVQGEVYQVININDAADGWDIVVLDNYEETKLINVPDNKMVTIVAAD